MSQSVAADTEYQCIYEKAIELLSRREHSRYELKQKLMRKAVDIDIVDRVIADLEQQQYLSHARYVEMIIHARMKRGYGPLHIRQTLEQQRIESELIEAGLVAVESEWLTAIQTVHAKKFAGQAPTTPVEYAKQRRFLSYRGFADEHIRSVVYLK